MEALAGESGWQATTVVAGCVAAVVLLGGAVQRRRKKKAAAARRLREARTAQVPLPERIVGEKDTAPGNGAPVLQGVRVVEIATIVAAPYATRVLGELGATVVKIEPKTGDMFRSLLAFADRNTAEGKKRAFSSFFDPPNLGGKLSLALDLSGGGDGDSGDSKKTAAQEEDMQLLDQLLKEADVLVTNVRDASAIKLGLDSAGLAKKYPHLIHAHLDAWGTGGPDDDLPGYDVGAFWAASGLSSLIYKDPEMTSKYPTGFGDMSAGISIVAGVAQALKRRLETGRGSAVNLSLLSTGLWVAAARLGQPDLDHEKLHLHCKHVGDDGDEDEFEIADADSDFATTALHRKSLCGPYQCADGRTVVLCSADTAAISALASDKEVTTQAEVAALFREMGDAHEVAEKFQQAGLAAFAIAALVTDDDARVSTWNGYVPQPLVRHPAVPDMMGFTQVPFALSVSQLHGFATRERASNLGVHRDALSRGWPERHPDCRLPTEPQDTTGSSALATDDGEHDENLVMRDVLVVELSPWFERSAGGIDGDSEGGDATVPLTGALMADAGAKVVMLEPPTGHILRTAAGAAAGANESAGEDGSSWVQMARGKRSLVVRDLPDSSTLFASGANDDEDIREAGRRVMAAVKQAAESRFAAGCRTVVFLTNLRDSHLTRLGLDEAALTQAVPQLRSVFVTIAPTLAPNGFEEPRGPSATIWYMSLLANALSGHQREPRRSAPVHNTLPAMVALYVYAAISVGVFHADRTDERAQSVRVGQTEVGLWVNSFSLCASARDGFSGSMLSRGLDVPEAEHLDRRLVPPFGSFITKDGQGVQLLFANLPFIPVVVKALGIRAMPLYAHALGRGLFRTILTRKLKLDEFLMPINKAYKKAIGERTWAELRADLKGKVPHTPILQPHQARRWRQPHHVGAFSHPAEEDKPNACLVVNNPVHVNRASQASHFHNRPRPTPTLDNLDD